MSEDKQATAGPEQVEAAAALRHATEIGRRSRATDRWPVVLWLLQGVVGPTVLIGIWVLPPGPVLDIVLWVPWVFIALSTLGWILARSESRLVQRLTPLVSAAGVGLYVVCLATVVLTVPRGWSLALVVLAVAPSLPPIYGAARVLAAR